MVRLLPGRLRGDDPGRLARQAQPDSPIMSSPPAVVTVTKFIAGEPMKPATNRLAGCV